MYRFRRKGNSKARGAGGQANGQQQQTGTKQADAQSFGRIGGPPTLDKAFLPSTEDFRTSLILPHLTRRFTLLRSEDGSLVSLDTMQAHLRAQRETGKLTEAEENIVLQQYRIQSQEEGLMRNRTTRRAYAAPSSNHWDIREEDETNTYSQHSKHSNGEGGAGVSVPGIAIYPVPDATSSQDQLAPPQSPGTGSSSRSNNLFGGRVRDMQYMRKRTKSGSSVGTSKSRDMSVSPMPPSDSGSILDDMGDQGAEPTGEVIGIQSEEHGQDQQQGGAKVREKYQINMDFTDQTGSLEDGLGEEGMEETENLEDTDEVEELEGELLTESSDLNITELVLSPSQIQRLSRVLDDVELSLQREGHKRLGSQTSHEGSQRTDTEEIDPDMFGPKASRVPKAADISRPYLPPPSAPPPPPPTISQPPQPVSTPRQSDQTPIAAELLGLLPTPASPLIHLGAERANSAQGSVYADAHESLGSDLSHTPPPLEGVDIPTALPEIPRTSPIPFPSPRFPSTNPSSPSPSEVQRVSTISTSSPSGETSHPEPSLSTRLSSRSSLQQAIGHAMTSSRDSMQTSVGDPSSSSRASLSTNRGAGIYPSSSGTYDGDSTEAGESPIMSPRSVYAFSFPTVPDRSGSSLSDRRTPVEVAGDGRHVEGVHANGKGKEPMRPMVVLHGPGHPEEDDTSQDSNIVSSQLNSASASASGSGSGSGSGSSAHSNLLSTKRNASTSSLASAGSSFHAEGSAIDSGAEDDFMDKETGIYQGESLHIQGSGCPTTAIDLLSVEDGEPAMTGNHSVDSFDPNRGLGGFDIKELAMIQDSLVRSASQRAAASSSQRRGHASAPSVSTQDHSSASHSVEFVRSKPRPRKDALEELEAQSPLTEDPSTPFFGGSASSKSTPHTSTELHSAFPGSPNSGQEYGFQQWGSPPRRFSDFAFSFRLGPGADEDNPTESYDNHAMSNDGHSVQSSPYGPSQPASSHVSPKSSMADMNYHYKRSGPRPARAASDASLLSSVAIAMSDVSGHSQTRPNAKLRGSNATPSVLIRSVAAQAEAATNALKTTAPFPHPPKERPNFLHRKSMKSLKTTSISNPRLVHSSADVSNMPMKEVVHPKEVPSHPDSAQGPKKSNSLASRFSRKKKDETRKPATESPEVSSPMISSPMSEGEVNYFSTPPFSPTQMTQSAGPSTMAFPLNSPPIGSPTGNSPGGGLKGIMSKLRRPRKNSEPLLSITPLPLDAAFTLEKQVSQEIGQALVSANPDKELPPHDEAPAEGHADTSTRGPATHDSPGSSSRAPVAYDPRSRWRQRMQVSVADSDSQISQSTQMAPSVTSIEERGETPSADPTRSRPTHSTVPSIDSMRKLWEAATDLGLDPQKVNELVALSYNQDPLVKQESGSTSGPLPAQNSGRRSSQAQPSLQPTSPTSFNFPPRRSSLSRAASTKVDRKADPAGSEGSRPSRHRRADSDSSVAPTTKGSQTFRVPVIDRAVTPPPVQARSATLQQKTPMQEQAARNPKFTLDAPRRISLAPPPSPGLLAPMPLTPRSPGVLSTRTTHSDSSRSYTDSLYDAYFGEDEAGARASMSRRPSVSREDRDGGSNTNDESLVMNLVDKLRFSTGSAYSGQYYHSRNASADSALSQIPPRPSQPDTSATDPVKLLIRQHKRNNSIGDRSNRSVTQVYEADSSVVHDLIQDLTGRMSRGYFDLVDADGRYPMPAATPSER